MAQAAARCAWTQWSAIGALTLHAPNADDEVVDIEALLLASLGLAARVPRLRTLATDWTLQNSQLVSIGRLRALMTGPFHLTGVEISELASRVALEGRDARWKALVPANATKPDEAGSRSRHAMRKAMPPRWRGSRTLMLQLRRGFGVGTKADLLAILLGARNAWKDTAELVELSGYTVAAVRKSADEMANAGVIETSGGHNRAFRADVMAWQPLLSNLEAPVWRRRADGFAFVLRWLAKAQQDSTAHRSELSLALDFGALMTDFWGLWLEVGVTQQPVSDDPEHAWATRNDVIDSLVQWFGATQ
ncbi:MAG: hypothetical protein ACYC7F_01415 [Gemmatimonadaceae bacterium]